MFRSQPNGAFSERQYFLPRIQISFDEILPLGRPKTTTPESRALCCFPEGLHMSDQCYPGIMIGS